MWSYVQSFSCQSISGGKNGNCGEYFYQKIPHEMMYLTMIFVTLTIFGAKEVKIAKSLQLMEIRHSDLTSLEVGKVYIIT